MQLKKRQVRRPTRSKQFTRKNEENVFFVHLCGRGLIWGGGGGGGAYRRRNTVSGQWHHCTS